MLQCFVWMTVGTCECLVDTDVQKQNNKSPTNYPSTYCVGTTIGNQVFPSLLDDSPVLLILLFIRQQGLPL